jgi:prepilin-type N-terminal cleavage/methylation domain-containing protein
MPGTRRPSWFPAAFTLLEVLIVLGVLAAAAAISWPSVSGLMAKGELRSAAKEVAAALARARLDAMDSDNVRLFRYAPGGGRFEVAPLAPAGEPANAPGPGRAGQTGRAAGGPVEKALPAGVRFVEPGGSRPGEAPAFGRRGEADRLTPAPQDPTYPAGSPFPRRNGGTRESARPAAAFAGEAWSAPLVFFPNGRTSSARLRLRGRHGYSVELSLRGATGTVRIGKVGQEEEHP